MPDDRRQRICDLFERACAVPVARRTAFLRRACLAAGTPCDDTLFDEVRSLVRAHDATRNPLDVPAAEAHAHWLAGDRPAPPDLRGYEIGDVLGEGGMGVVYLAEQTIPVRRMVALKVLKPGLDIAQVARRFELERQTLALMHHTGIAQIYDSGVASDGRPFFAMEYVRGETITAFCDARRLTIRQRLEVFVEVCDAVEHAHENAIIHRDLKPSNILVATQDGRPLPKVIDFGIAKERAPARDHTLLTRGELLLGTPEYMSPEQATNQGPDVDIRTDVYSLGVVLYELLVGALPFDGPTRHGPAGAAMLRRLCEREPRRASSRLRRADDESVDVAARRGASRATLRRQVRGDLDRVVMKAVDRERERRYVSVSELAADIRRYLRNEPVTARRPSAVYQLSMFVRRNRDAVAAAGVVLLTLLGGLLVSVCMYLRSERNLEELVVASEKLLDQGTATDLRHLPGGEPTRIQLVDEALRISERLLDRDPGDAALLRQVFRSRYRLGQLRMELGQLSAAERALRGALQTAEQLDPDDPVASELSRAAVELDLVRVLRDRRAVAEATERAERLARSLTRRVSSEPTWPGRALAASAWREVALLASWADRGAEAVAAARRAWRVVDEARGHPRGRPWFLASLAESAKLLGQVSARHAEHEPFAEHFERAVAAYRELIELAGRAPEQRHLLALAFDSWSATSMRRGDWHDALDKTRAGLEILDRLTAEYPLRAPYAASWLLGQHKLVAALSRVRGADRAVQACRDAVARGTALAARHPDHANLARRLALVQDELARLERVTAGAARPAAGVRTGLPCPPAGAALAVGRIRGRSPK